MAGAPCSVSRQLATEPLRAAPSVTISIGLESRRPMVRVLAFTVEDHERLADWLASQRALRAIVGAALEAAEAS